jgi:HSP20 family molecular chaperone IbpA
VYRRLEFASPVDLEKIIATLDKGVLHLLAPKAAEVKARKIHVAAAKAS